MSSNALFGLTPSLLALYGIKGAAATSYFGKAAVQEFVQDTFNFSNPAIYQQQNLGKLFDAAIQVEKSTASLDPSLANFATNYTLAVNSALESSLGIGLSDINYAYTGGTTGSVSVGGYGSHSFDFGDILSQALSQANAQLASLGITDATFG